MPVAATDFNYLPTIKRAENVYVCCGSYVMSTMSSRAFRTQSCVPVWRERDRWIQACSFTEKPPPAVSIGGRSRL